MQIHIFRTAMCGGGLSYDVLIPEKECPDYVRQACPGGTYYTRIVRDDCEYLDYEHATMTREHCGMEQGWPRYEAWKNHEDSSRRRMLQLAASVYPELKPMAAAGGKLPTLWVTGLMKKETSDLRLVEVAAREEVPA